MTATSPGRLSRLLRWLPFVVALGAILAVSAPGAIASVGEWLAREQERLPWYATRLTAFLSWAALTGSVIYGLLLSTKLLDAIAHRAVSFTLHQDLASVGLGLGLVHAALLTLDRTVPFTLAELLVPFASPYRPVWVGLGQLTLAGTAVVIASFSIRRRIGQRSWRRLHYLTFLIFLGGTVHGLMAGSDTAAPWAFWSYTAAAATVVFLMGYRIAIAITARHGDVPRSTVATPDRRPRNPRAHHADRLAG